MAVLDLLPTSGIGWLVIGFLAFFISKCVYCLTLHPLACFPGPTLAAITRFYGGFFDLRSDTSYVKKLPELHRKYGLNQVELTPADLLIIKQGPLYEFGPINSMSMIWTHIISISLNYLVPCHN